MSFEGIWVNGAWHSGAPYSPATRKGPFVFASGAVPVDRVTGATAGTDIAEQTNHVIDNLEAVLDAAGATLADVVKTTVFLTDQSLAAGMNLAYAERFKPPRPARSTVVVGPLARPEFLIEIEAVALTS